MPPQVIARRYRVEREVGRGGMGSVWLCRDELLGRDVAVKQVGHLPGESTPDLARAMREARSSAALNHRNVVSIYDAIEEGDHIWLVMEYVPGRTLSAIMNEDGPLLPERAAWIGAQVADGLAAAHARGTIHRDVKPGNILVTVDDQAKISDFGIARTLGDAQLTQSGLVTGTPAYFSPGLARGEEPVEADDVWALGATLYAATEGRPPFPEQRNAIAMLTAITTGRPPRPEHAGFLTEPIGRMLDPDPRSRWSMADVAHALHRLHDEHAVGGTREATAVAAPSAGAVTAGSATTAATPVATPAPTPEPAAEPTGVGGSRPRRRRGVLVALALALLVLAAGGAWLALGTADDGADQAAPSTPKSSRSPGETPSSTGGAASSETSAPTPETTPAEPAPAPAGTGSKTKFVEGYYGVLPSDTETAWSLLSPDYQANAGSYEKYRGFWQTIDAVSVDDTEPAGPDAVDVTLTYTDDGGTEQEVRRIYVERSGDGYLITDDEVVG